MLVSVIIPCYNEENYIKRCILSIINSAKKINSYEIIVVDGLSTDNTVKIVKELIKKNKKIKLFFNKKKFAPAALNIGIEKAKGKYIMRCDAHAKYHNNYILECVKLHNSSDKKVMNVGGVVKLDNINNSLFGELVVNVNSSLFGNGPNKFRISKDEETKFKHANKNIVKEVQTVPYGFFKKKIFKILKKKYNESNPFNEDLELNKRIISSGYKILQSSKLVTTYYVRNNLISYLKQVINNGYVISSQQTFHFTELKHWAPFLFVSTIIFSLINFFYDFNLNINKLLLSLVALYILLNIIFSIHISIKLKSILALPCAFLLFFLLHFFYGIGTILGFVFSIKEYKIYLQRSFPAINPFNRNNYSKFHNFVKFCSLIFSYFLFKLKINEKHIFILSFLAFVSAVYFWNVSLKTSNIQFFISSYLIFGLVIFFDFIDGNLARAFQSKNLLGDEVDNFNPDLFRFFSLYLVFYHNNFALLQLIAIPIFLAHFVFFSKIKNLQLDNNSIFFKIYEKSHSIIFLYFFILPIFGFCIFLFPSYLNNFSNLFAIFYIYLFIHLILFSLQLKKNNLGISS